MGIGTHEELLQSCEVYQEIFASQYQTEGKGGHSMSAQKARKGTLKKVLGYIRPYWVLVGLSVLLAAVTVGGQLVHPHLDR